MELIQRKIIALCLLIFISCGLCVTSIKGEMLYEINRQRMQERDRQSNKRTVHEHNSRDGSTDKTRDDSGDDILGAGLCVTSNSSFLVGVGDSVKDVVESCVESNNNYISVSNSVTNSGGNEESSASGSESISECNYIYGVSSTTTEGNWSIENAIRTACNNYGIDSNVALGIARLETGNFTSAAYVNGNNPGGMSINEIPIVYSTIEEGVEAFVSNLANNYFNIGLTTPETIGQKYCPINPNWANLVRQMM